MLFLADRGAFSARRTWPSSRRTANQYVIPLPKSDRRCRVSVALEARGAPGALHAMLLYMGVTLLQASLGAGRPAQDIWALYKRR